MIKVITGPMFSGKSAMLIEHANYYRNSGRKKIYYIKPIVDSKHIDSIGSRNNESIFANSFPTKLDINEYSQYLDAFKQYKMDAVIIDEAQFFGNWIVDFVFKCKLIGVDVIIAGLDMDAFGNPFGSMGDLMCIADDIEKLKSVCSVCKWTAGFTVKLNDNPEVISIGGDEKYEPRCAKHLNTNKDSNI